VGIRIERSDWEILYVKAEGARDRELEAGSRREKKKEGGGGRGRKTDCPAAPYPFGLELTLPTEEHGRRCVILLGLRQHERLLTKDTTQCQSRCDGVNPIGFGLDGRETLLERVLLDGNRFNRGN